MAKVLIVDDEQMVLHSTQRLLASLGYDTATVNEAPRILESIRRERPDVVLQDVRMPGLDVEALLRRLREDPEVGGTPVVLFSASMEIFDLEERVHPAGVLEKPFKPAEAVAVIERAFKADVGASRVLSPSPEQEAGAKLA
ncbi:MAG TPA: response regulator [Candidatus Thermoplasmatota archaeon]|nr:response regulator [Candidatus Thermoplasmatota archaeon]